MIHQPIVIVGGGPVGLSLALAIAGQGKPVTLIDHGYSKASDGRVLALSYASYQTLAGLNAWPAAAATAIDCVEISHQGLGISQINAERLNLPQLGFTIKYGDLCAFLLNQAQQNPLINLITATVCKVDDGRGYALIYLQQGLTTHLVTAELVILAEGGNLLSGAQLHHDYQQHALVAPITTAKQSQSKAFERFSSQGPLVLLPYANHYVVVWSVAAAVAEELVQDQQQFIAQLDQVYTKRLGGAQLLAAVKSFPLKLVQTKSRLRGRILVIGNSAQIVHPISAQGLNLGLRDMQTLADILGAGSELNRAGLRNYDQQRQRDVAAVVGFTHFLATGLEKPGKRFDHLRGLGLIGLSNLPLLQNYIARSLIFGI